jgi:hypothetical protein
LRSELDGIRKRIRRLVTNLEAQEPDSEIADDIRSRLEELAALRAKKQQALETAEKEMAQVPDPESAEALVAALPLLDVDWELVSDMDFRDLLATLNFEARYDPNKRELTIRVTLVPELTSPDGTRAPLLSVPPAGFEPATPSLGNRTVPNALPGVALVLAGQRHFRPGHAGTPMDKLAHNLLHGCCTPQVKAACRYESRDESTQNSLPSGSLRTTHDCSPWPTSA